MQKARAPCIVGGQGNAVLFASCALLVQGLLIAKRDLRLARTLKRISKLGDLIGDDISIVQQSRKEMEVLLLSTAERYERRCALLASNLPPSKWKEISSEPATLEQFFGVSTSSSQHAQAPTTPSPVID